MESLLFINRLVSVELFGSRACLTWRVTFVGELGDFKAEQISMYSNLSFIEARAAHNSRAMDTFPGRHRMGATGT